MKGRVKIIGHFALGLLTASCVLGPEPRFPPRVADGSYCVSMAALDVVASRRAAEEADVQAQAAVAAGYSPRSLQTARAIGALAQVDRLAAAVLRSASAAEIADLRGQVNDTISLASLDLASTVANLACEEGRAGQIASDLRSAEQAQTRTLTAYSLILSAAAAVAGGVLSIADKNPVPGGAVGITGGLVGGAFGFATLAVRRTTTFRHVHNILGEVWKGGAHSSFPNIVWAYLTRPEFSRTADRTLRDYLVSSWMQSGTLGSDGMHLSAGRLALYFGDGGTYDASGLDDRVDMLSDVREVVNLMNHGLQHLADEVAHR
jgi:hypothetical protein